MRKSARIMGRDYGVTAEVMNGLLKNAGFLEGEPGGYSPTKKAEPFVNVKHEHRGPGGYAQFNRDWDVTTWDDSIQDELEITPEKISEVKETLSERRRKKREEKQRFSEEYYASLESTNDDNETGNELLLTIAGAVFGLGMIGYAKAKPKVINWWEAKAKPKINELMNKNE